jgi:hypothetical protein
MEILRLVASWTSTSPRSPTRWLVVTVHAGGAPLSSHGKGRRVAFVSESTGPNGTFRATARALAWTTGEHPTLCRGLLHLRWERRFRLDRVGGATLCALESNCSPIRCTIIGEGACEIRCRQSYAVLRKTDPLSLGRSQWEFHGHN